jgi:hypothetical protein
MFVAGQYFYGNNNYFSKITSWWKILFTALMPVNPGPDKGPFSILLHALEKPSYTS